MLFTTTSAVDDILDKGLRPLLALLDINQHVSLHVVAHDVNSLPGSLREAASRVKVSFRMPRDHMSEVYQTALASCRISEKDSSPVSVLDAMLCGVPVIVSPLIAENFGGIIRDFETGFVVAPDDLTGLDQRVRLLAGDRSLRDRVGEAGRRAALRHPALGKVEQLQTLIERMPPL